MDMVVGLEPERFALELLFASIRTAAALALLPSMGGQLIPVRVRIGLAGAVGFLAMGTAHAPVPPADILSFAGFLAIGGEILVGAVVALALHAAFAVAAIAGDWVAQSMGVGFAMAVEPGAPPSPVVSALFGLVMWAVFLQAGGHLILIGLLVESYRAMPSGAAILAPAPLSAIFGWGGLAIASGVLAALPLGAALLLVNLALAVAARSAPQLNLFSIGFPLMLLAGLVGLPLMLPGLVDSFAAAITTMQRELAGLLLGR